MCSLLSNQIILNTEFANNNRHIFANFAKKNYIVMNEFSASSLPTNQKQKFADNNGQIIANFAKKMVMNEFLSSVSHPIK